MIPFPKKKYNIIYADPAWSSKSTFYQNGGRPRRNINEQYPTMSIKDIKNLPVKDIADKDCILFLWTTDSNLSDALDIIKIWNFKYKTIGFTWVKQYKSGSYCYNFGSYTLKSTEICLIGLKGKLKNIKKTHNIKGLVFAERTTHSKKPDEIRNRITELCGDLPRIELFARQKVEGWDSWGNEV